MPITVVCPGCSAKLNAPDSAAGKKVKCPKAGCGKLIGVPEPLAPQFEVVEDNPPPKPAPRKAAKEAIDDDSQPKKKRREDDEDVQPKSKRRRDDDDDEDERPRSKRRQDDDDDDEDERPRKKKKKQKSAGLSPMLLVGIVFGGLLLVGGVGYGVYALVLKKDETASSSGGSGGSGGGSGSSSKAAVPTGWVEFKSDADKFKAYFPVKPEEHTLEFKVYDAEDKVAKYGCVVFIETPPTTIYPEKRKEAGAVILAERFTGYGAKELSRKDSTLAGYATTEIVFAEPAKGKKGGKGAVESVGRGVFRVVVTDTKVIMVGITSDTGMPKPELVNGFFDNFELLK